MPYMKPIHKSVLLVFSFLCLGFLLHPKLSMSEVLCGGSFETFVSKLKQESISNGYSPSMVNNFYKKAQLDPKVLKADRSQGIFTKNFLKFSNAAISNHRIKHAAINDKKYKNVFDAIEQKYGVPRGILLAFWALETDFGAVQGNYNTLNALITLSHDCRRPKLFQQQLFGALELFKRNQFDVENTKGAWAGEIGMLQMLPLDILENARDGDNDGLIDIIKSPADALYSAAETLISMGWNSNQPWMQEVTVPEHMDWSLTGLDKTLPIKDWIQMGVQARWGNFQSGVESSIILPMGRKGPAFITYPNFNVLFEWNKSYVYVTTAAYFATLLSGEEKYTGGSPNSALSLDEMKMLQEILKILGYNMGEIDGILGAKTRAAVRKEQIRNGLPADSWPTRILLKKLS